MGFLIKLYWYLRNRKEDIVYPANFLPGDIVYETDEGIVLSEYEFEESVSFPTEEDLIRYIKNKTMPEVKIEIEIDEQSAKDKLKEDFFDCVCAVIRGLYDSEINTEGWKKRNDVIFDHFFEKCVIMFSKKQEEARKINVRVENGEDSLSNKEFRYLIRAIADLQIEKAFRKRQMDEAKAVKHIEEAMMQEGYVARKSLKNKKTDRYVK